MAALPAVSKVVRADFYFSQGHTANMQVREFFQYSGTLNGTDATAWCATMQGAMGTMISSIFSTTLTHYKTELTDLSSTSAPQDINTDVTAGGEPGAANDAQTAFIVRKLITRRYRGGHPRVYLPGTINSWLTNPTQWAGSSITVVMTGYNAFISTITSTVPSAAGTGTHVNVSYYHGFTTYTPPSGRTRVVPTLRATPVVDAIIGTAGVATPGSQRRRNETP